MLTKIVKIYWLFLACFLFSNMLLSQCLQINIEVLSEPFCLGSYNGGQLNANVQGGSGEYTYEWVNASGSFLPGGPQTNPTTYSFLPLNLECWVYVTDLNQNCVDSASYTFTEYACTDDTTEIQVYSQFDINPVGYNTYSECEIQLENQGCEVQFKPEFIISHQTDIIEPNDLTVEYYNSQSVWKTIDYTINSSGQAVGYWGSESGETLNCDELRIRPVRVKFNQFNPTSPLGQYDAILRVWSVDQDGILQEIISEEEPISLTLIDTICDELQMELSVTDASCPDQSNGQVEISASGGQEPYLFSFNNSLFSQTNMFDNLSYGMYYISTKDASGCQNSDSIYINPEPVLPDSLWFTNVGSNSASINWTADSLVDGYKFRYKKSEQPWSSAQVVASGVFDNGIAEMNAFKILSNLDPLTDYQVQVKTNSLLGCQEGWSSTIYAFTTSFDYSYNLNHSCSQTSSGQITFEIETDNVYTFEWSSSNGFSSNDASISNLSLGDYQLLVSIDSDIVFDTTFTILISTSNIDLSLNGQILNQNVPLQLCDESNYLQATSGFSNYIWSNGQTGPQSTIFYSDSSIFVEAIDTNNCPVFSDTLYTQTNNDFVNLIEANQNEEFIQANYSLCSNEDAIEIDISQFITGDYIVQWYEIDGQDSINLVSSTNIDLIPGASTNYLLEISDCFYDFSVDYFLSPQLYYDIQSPLCYGDTNASIVLYSDSLSPTTHFTLANSNNEVLLDQLSTQLSDTVHDLVAGQYVATLENIWFCSTQEILNITQPQPLLIDNFANTDLVCFGDSNAQISYELSGGTFPYNYLINSDSSLLNGQIYSGSFDIVFSDDNNCLIDTVFVVNESASITLSVIDSLSFNASCFGDNDAQISAFSSGGVPPYIFGLDGHVQASSTFSELTAGVYTLSVQDDQGCNSEMQVEVIQPDQALIIENYELSDTLGYCALCEGDSTGQISIDLLGGSSPYTIHMLDNQNTFNSSFINNLIGGGNYHFYATDSEGCFSDTISVLCNSPSELSFSIPTESISTPTCCYSCDASLALEATGGVQPFQYQLNNTEFQSDGVFSQLCGDSIYILRIIDQFGCSIEESIVINNSPCLTIDTINFINNQQSAVASDSCKQDGTAKIYVEVANAVGGSFISIDNMMNSVEGPSCLFDQLSTGSHTIYAQDSQLCMDSLEVVIPEITAVTTELLFDTMYCTAPYISSLSNQSDLGAIYVQAFESANSNFQYSLDQLDSSNYVSDGAFDNLEETTYTLNVKDENGCIYEYDIELPSYTMGFEYSVVNVSCPGFNDGSIEVTDIVSEGNSWLTLNDTLINTNTEIFGLDEGEYELIAYYTFSDSSQYCYNSISFEIDQNEPLDFFYTIKNVSCFDYCDASISIDSAFGGNQPYSFVNMNQVDTNILFDNLCAGQYSFKMIDSLGCSVIQDITIFEGNAIYPIIEFQNGNIIVLEPTNNNPSMGTPPYSYNWFLDEVPILENDQDTLVPTTDGVYMVLVTDSLDCKGQSSSLIVNGLKINSNLNRELNIYPNPFINDLRLISTSSDSYNYQLTDVKGHILRSGIFQNQKAINTADLSHGMYFLRLTKNQETIVYKILKQ